MISLNSIDTILDSITKTKNHNRGYLTNFFLDIPKSELWIKQNLFFYDVIGETFFFFKKNLGFYNLFYITPEISIFQKDFDVLLKNNSEEVFVIDLLGQMQDIEKLKDKLAKVGFHNYTSLVRMSKLQTQVSNSESCNPYVYYSRVKECYKVFELLQKYFDPYAEQLPLIEEILFWSQNNNILIYCDDSNEIQGFLIYELKGMTSYLRYWFVHPDYRDKKIGSTLFRKFLGDSSDSKRQIFWVIDSNDNAIKRYEHYGFKKETLMDSIMININKNYEGKDN
jgi:ribosomal protein S18 acetylase RimI-like enzyme